MLNIVLFGPPGAGKGTQADRLVETYGFHHISTGEIIRAEIGRGSKLGRSVEESIKRGELAADEIVIEIVADYVAKHKDKDVNGNIFDGFPRTIRQAEGFDRILAEHGLRVDIMLSMDVPDDELIRRLLHRGKDSGRADDSNESVIRKRIDIYKAQTAIVADYYSKQNKFVSVDGLGSFDEVFNRLCVEINLIRQ